MISPEPSVEPSSTTIISFLGHVCADADSIAEPTYAAALWQGIKMETNSAIYSSCSFGGFYMTFCPSKMGFEPPNVFLPQPKREVRAKHTADQCKITRHSGRNSTENSLRLSQD